MLTSLALTFLARVLRVVCLQQQQQQQQESKSRARQILFLLGAIVRCSQAWYRLVCIPLPASMGLPKSRCLLKASVAYQAVSAVVQRVGVSTRTLKRVRSYWSGSELSCISSGTPSDCCRI